MDDVSRLQIGSVFSYESRYINTYHDIVAVSCVRTSPSGRRYMFGARLTEDKKLERWTIWLDDHPTDPYDRADFVLKRGVFCP